MNNLRRKDIRELIDIIGEAKDRLELLAEEEEGYRDSIPENLQGSERYEQSEAAVEAMATAFDNLEEAISALEEACGDC